MGLATQHVLSQAVAGVFICISRSFKAKVAARGQEGVVEDITSLYTVLETDKAHILIPNSMLISNTLTRYKAVQTATQGKETSQSACRPHEHPEHTVMVLKTLSLKPTAAHVPTGF